MSFFNFSSVFLSNRPLKYSLINLPDFKSVFSISRVIFLYHLYFYLHQAVLCKTFFTEGLFSNPFVSFDCRTTIVVLKNKHDSIHW